jgi:hypothetical protein
MLYFFGPYLPVDVFVKEEQARDAHALLYERLAPKDHDLERQTAEPTATN